jgi:hypothetical protein
MFQMIHLMTHYKSKTISCYIGNFFKTKDVHQLSTLSGMMVALGYSKVTKLGIFSHVT